MSSYEMQIASVIKPFVSWEADNLALQFFVYFARFEYAMKCSGYLKSSNGFAEADWDKLGNYLHDNNFNRARTSELQTSINYLTSNPPRKQVVKNGLLDWGKPVEQADLERFSRYILRIVCIVRNNLFHGGKFPLPTGLIAESSRDRELLQHCLVVLVECSKCATALQSYLTLDV